MDFLSAQHSAVLTLVNLSKNILDVHFTRHNFQGIVTRDTWGTPKQTFHKSTSIQKGQSLSLLLSSWMQSSAQSSWSHLPHSQSTHSRPVWSRASSWNDVKHTQHMFVSVTSCSAVRVLFSGAEVSFLISYFHWPFVFAILTPGLALLVFVF